ncbi:MAG TPA: hypothetical protein VK025_16390, partial [Steroidobacter sp.]|nr:hypothetical protein [Steroidobacter sp.]
MPAYYTNTARAFLHASSDEVLGALSRASRHEITPEQGRAWAEEINILKAALASVIQKQASAREWGVLLEFPLLRLGRRLDAVVLAGSAVCVLEFKVGATSADAASRRQVEDYAADLRYFHAPTRILPVFSAVCATGMQAAQLRPSISVEEVARAQALAPNQVAEFLLQARESAKSPEQISVHDWNAGAYRPVPTIIQAASMIYVQNSVAEIRTALSSHANLTATVDRRASK